MARKAEALAMDLMNNALGIGDERRGFKMRIHYTPRWFTREYSIVMFDYNDHKFTKTINFHSLSDCINVASKMEDAIQKAQDKAVREATTR